MINSQDFALTEAVMLLTTLAQRWQARLVPRHPVDVQTRFTSAPSTACR